MVKLGKLGSAPTTPTSHDDTKHSDSGNHILKDGSVAFTGDQPLGANKLTGVKDPTAAQDAATKKYVDDNEWDAIEHTAIGDSAPHHAKYTDAEAIAAVEGETTLDLVGPVTIASSLDITHVSTEDDDHALEIDLDAAGHGDVKALDIDYITGAIVDGDDEGVILINIDEIAAGGGDVFGLEVLATEGLAGIYGMKTGVGIGPVHQDSGTFITPTTGIDNGDDASEMYDDDPDTTRAIFEDGPPNQYIIIGNVAAFEELEFILATGSSGAGIKPTFAYSTGGANFTPFSPVDGTNGFRNTGVVAWDASDLTSHAASENGTFDIKITRTRANLSTTPVLRYAKTAATTEYLWDKDGNLNLAALSLTGNIVVGGTVDGVDIAARDHAKYTNAEAVAAIEALSTLEFDGATLVKTATGDLSLWSADGDLILISSAGIVKIYGNSPVMQGGTGDPVHEYRDKDGNKLWAILPAANILTFSKWSGAEWSPALTLSATGGTFAGDLTVANLITAGNVDGVDVSDLAAKVQFRFTNTTEDPTASEDIYITFTNKAVTLTEMRAIVRGTSPSVTWTIRHHTDRSNAGNEVVTGGTTTTSTTTGDDVVAFDDATIPADSHIWLETTAKSGTVDEFSITGIGAYD